MNDAMKNDTLTLANAATGVVRLIIRRHPERLRFMATGLLSVTECSLGGHCRCGKSLEERDILFAPDKFLAMLDHHAGKFDREYQAMTGRLIEQIRAACPPGSVIDESIVEELCVTPAEEVALRALLERAKRAEAIVT